MDRWFLLENLVLKDFRIRYRNMSLGVLWSVANPLLMMGLLTFVFTCIYPNRSIPNFAAFVLCALVPCHFYSLALSAGTTALWDNETLVKRTRCPRRIFPIAAVLANCLHFLIQAILLLGVVLLLGYRVNRYWPLLIPIWGLEVVFMCGLALFAAILDVYYRDLRYVAEASGMVMFWVVPVFYSMEMVPARYRILYLLNPIAAVASAGRSVLLYGHPPSASLWLPLVTIPIAILIGGIAFFSRFERGLVDYL